jgi:type IV pilus assembly protein PilB
MLTGCEIVPLITTEESLMENFRAMTGADTETIIADAAKELPAAEVEVTSEENEELSIEELTSSADEEPIIRLVNAIIVRGISREASDIHIQPERNRVRVRYRVDGVLHDGPALPLQVAKPVISRIKVVSHMNIAEKRVPQDGRLSLRSDGIDYDLRVSTLPGISGEKVVLRVAKQSSELAGIAKLGFSTGDRSRFEELIARPYGLILVTGPTGSGKSTTLYAALHQLNDSEKNIITIEDPVEQKIPGLTQIEVNPRAGLTFPSVLRSVLRQDPDIAMVGEIRDRETALLASEASLTGHLVLSTLHTNDAPTAITRLLDMNVEPFLIATTTIGVLAQRLVRRLCRKCREEYEASAMALRRLGFEPETPEDTVKLYRAQGCPHCSGTGYKGRIGVFELLAVSDAVKEAILERRAAGHIKALAIREGMTTMARDAIAKILSGITTLEEALRVIDIEHITAPAETPVGARAE